MNSMSTSWDVDLQRPRDKRKLARHRILASIVSFALAASTVSVGSIAYASPEYGKSADAAVQAATPQSSLADGARLVDMRQSDLMLQITQQENAARAAAIAQAKAEAIARAEAEARAKVEAEAAARRAEAQRQAAYAMQQAAQEEAQKDAQADQTEGSDEFVMSPQADPNTLEGHIVPGLDPENTTVNLFNYSATGYDTATGEEKPDANPNNGDVNGNTGAASPQVNYDTWLNNPDSINYGHLLTFGDGMRHLGYWNQGIVQSYGEIANERPGMQGIVSPWLDENGYPSVNAGTYYLNPDTGDVSLTPVDNTIVVDTTMGPNLENPSKVGWYGDNPELYSTAKRHVGNPAPQGYDEMVYFNAGPNWSTSGNGTVGNPSFDPVQAQNIAKAVLARVLNPGLAGSNNGESGSYVLNQDQLSLRYLFDPSVTSPGKQSYKDVTGLFQIDSQGYFYYNMRDNFAEFVQSAQGNSDGHFVLYDEAAGLRTDGTNSIGNFFPFNKANEVFKIEDGRLVNALRADNNYGAGTGPLADHHLGMTVETNFRQPIGGKVAGKDMTFEFLGDDDVWVFIDDVLVLDLGGIHSELYGTINFSTGEVNLGTAFNNNGAIYETDADGNTVYDEDGNPVYIIQPVIKTTIKNAFERAGVAGNTQWNGDTFASSTSHTIKMFYLERGNYDSSLMIRFNLQQALFQQIKKVDQEGNALAGAEFELYEVETPAGYDASNISEVELKDVKPIGAPLAKLVTDSEGQARFMSALDSHDGQEQAFNFSDRYNAQTNAGLLYILREINAPAGYKPLPTDLLLRFNPANTMLAVNNRYQTGSYASFNSYVYAITGSTHYGQIGLDGGLVTQIEGAPPVSEDIQKNGLVLAVPMLKKTSSSTAERSSWLPLIGDNLTGFTTVSIPYGFDPSEDNNFRLLMRTLTLTAALQQAALYYEGQHGDGVQTEGWHLNWNDDYRRLEGTLENLPGRADRYLNVNPDGDMRMFYGIITPEALARAFGISVDEVAAMTTQQRYDRLAKIAQDAIAAPEDPVNPSAFSALVNLIDPGTADSTYDQRGYTPLDSREFVRNFRSVIYIPNEQRQLRVLKVDQSGAPVNGVQFALYDSAEKAQAGGSDYAAAGYTATVDGRDGMLIFEPRQSHESDRPGYADMAWPFTSFSAGDQAITYYLKEISAPAGYELNATVVPVKVGVYSVYADAGTPDDDVSVMAGVGKLMQTMVKYASEGEVNITLRDITAFAQGQASGSFDLNGWADEALDGTDVTRQMNLHYGTNAVIDYGLSDEDGGLNYEPFFVTDTGYIRARVQQNYAAHLEPGSIWFSDANSDDLGDMDITGLFSLINTVVVTNRNTTITNTGELMISKNVEGDQLADADYLKAYHFKVEFFDANGQELHTAFPFYGTDRSGTLQSGDTVLLHHDEAIVIQGLPVGGSYIVTELDANQDGFSCTITDADGIMRGEGVARGVIRENQQMLAAFNNAKNAPQLGNLLIKKTVEGDNLTDEDLQRVFHFKVELFNADGTVLTGRYAVSDLEGVTSIVSGDQIGLRHGQSAIVLYLPAGCYYVVTELDANQHGYRTATASLGGRDAVIKDGETAEASFVNTKIDPEEPVKPEDPVKPNDPEKPETPPSPDKPEGPETPVVPNEPVLPIEPTPASYDLTPKTGDESQGGLLALGAMLCAALAACFVTGRSRRREEL